MVCQEQFHQSMLICFSSNANLNSPFPIIPSFAVPPPFPFPIILFQNHSAHFDSCSNWTPLVLIFIVRATKTFLCPSYKYCVVVPFSFLSSSQHIQINDAIRESFRKLSDSNQSLFAILDNLGLGFPHSVLYEIESFALNHEVNLIHLNMDTLCQLEQESK